MREDTGVPYDESRKDLFEIERQSDVALGFEPAFGGGMDKVTVARRGIGRWTLEVEGKRGHSSAIFGPDAGDGAAYELARILDGFRRAFGEEDYLTLNPGLVISGSEMVPGDGHTRVAGKMNIMPASGLARGYLRFLTPEQQERTQRKMQEIVAGSLPQTSAKLTFGSTHPPMPPRPGNDRLLEMLDGVSRSLGDGALTSLDPGKRGAADISFVSDIVPGLCGLGAAGGGAHAYDEWMDLALFPNLIKRTALLLANLSQTDAQEFADDR